MLAVRNAGAAVERGVSRRQCQVGAQARTPQEIGAEARVVPQIRHAAGGGLLLFVVQMDVVIGDVGQVLGREIELRRIDFLALGALRREIQIGGEAAAWCSSP